MIGKKSSTAPLLWLALVLSIALVISFLLPVTPNDYWWYLRIGRDTLTQMSIPRTDSLTWSQAGTPIVYHSWGAAVIFWLVYRLGGLTLSVFLRGLLVACAYALVWLTARRQGAGRAGAALLLLLAVLATSNNWSMRPQLLTYPLFSLSLYLLYRWQKGDQKAVFWLPLISLVWVNLHGSFILLILLVSAALVFGSGDRRTLAVAAAGILLASFINPRGAGAWSYVIHSLTVPSSQVFSTEWRPPVNDNWQMNLFFLWLLAFPLLVAFSPRKLRRLEWSWFLGFGLLALLGERYVIWFVFILAVLTAELLADWEIKYLREPKTGSTPLNLGLSLALLLMTLLLLPGIRQAWWQAAPESTENTPVAATTWLSSRPELEGPLWSEIGFSSYLELNLPERPVWIDTRFELFPVEQWQAYKDTSEARANWQTSLDESGANLLMVSTMKQAPLIAALDGTQEWSRLYGDEVAVVYQRCGVDRP